MIADVPRYHYNQGMSRNDFLYTDRIVVTGAGSGIGKAVAERFASEGYTVFGLSRTIEEKRTDVGKGSITGVRCDVTDDESISHAIERIGDFSIIVHSAGFGIAGAAEDTPPDAARKQIETNYFGVLNMNRHALPVMRKHAKSLVVIISSIAGRVPIPFQSHYSSSKYALEAYAGCLKMEAACFGVECTLVEPGDIRTGFTEHRSFPHIETSVYKDMAERAVARMEEDELNGMSPQSVADVVFKVSKKKHPPLRVAVGFQYKALMALARLLPDSVILAILKKMYRV